MSFLFILCSFISLNIFADEIQTQTQHINIRKQDQIGWQQDLSAKINLNRKLDFGLQGTYLERFNFFEKRFGASVSYKPNSKWSFDLKYLQGIDNVILPEKQTILNSYYAFGEGISPFISYRDTKYSATLLHTLSLGMEIEKIPHIIIIPTAMFGKATFISPAKTEDVFSYGIRAIYYQERNFSYSIFAIRGKEASQGVIGKATELIDTLTGGLSFSYFFTSFLKAEFIFDHTNYEQLNNEFHTTTLNMTWIF